MREFGNSHMDLDLRCDFPARESFRDDLLSHLLDMDESEMRATAAQESDCETRELSDSELEMLAAAGVDTTPAPSLSDDPLGHAH